MTEFYINGKNLKKWANNERRLKGKNQHLLLPAWMHSFMEENMSETVRVWEFLLSPFDLCING